jgi:hypothetical protein
VGNDAYEKLYGSFGLTTLKDEFSGAKPNISYFNMLRYLHKRATGEFSYEEFGKKFRMVESSSIKIMYIGYALKKFSSHIGMNYATSF